MDGCRNVRGLIAAAVIVSFLPAGGLVGTALAATPENQRGETPQRTVMEFEDAGLAVHRISGRTLRDQIRELDSEPLLRLLDAQPRPVARKSAAAQAVASPPSHRNRRLKAVAVVAGVAVAGALLLKGIKEYRDIPK